jgi:hypothetical protein
MSEPLYYIRNKGFCGNCLRWWKKGGHGYTSNLDEAWKLGKAQAEIICSQRRLEDFPYLVSAMDAIAERHVNIEKLRLLDEETDAPKT